MPSTSSDGFIKSRGLETAAGEVIRLQAFPNKPCVEGAGDNEQKLRRNVTAVKM